MTIDVEFSPDCAPFADAIASMTRAAFAAEFGNGDGEAVLIAALRADGDVVVELVALERSVPVGHILFSRVTVDVPELRIAGLAPLCTRTDCQRRGIGSALVRAGLGACREAGIDAVMVVGEPRFYIRFGFSVAPAAHLACAYAGPHFMAAEFTSGALARATRMDYAPAFARSGV